MLQREPGRLVAGRRLRDDLEALLCGEHGGEADADHLVVVGDEDADGRRRSGGVGGIGHGFRSAAESWPPAS